MNDILNVLTSDRLWSALIMGLLCFLIWLALRRLLIRAPAVLQKLGLGKKDPEMLLDRVKLILIIVFLVQLLEIFGVNLSSLFAGLGIAGAVAAFAVQDILKDVVMGSNILTGNYFSVGDVIRYGDVQQGKVIGFTVRTTRLKDLSTGNIVNVANRNISEVTVLSDWQDLDVPAPYEEKAERMRDVCEKICRRIEELEDVEKCVFMGTQELGESAIYYRLRITGPRDLRSPIRRAALGCVQDVYAEEGISVPYPSMNVLQKR